MDGKGIFGARGNRLVGGVGTDDGEQEVDKERPIEESSIDERLPPGTAAPEDSCVARAIPQSRRHGRKFSENVHAGKRGRQEAFGAGESRDDEGADNGGLRRAARG